MESLDVSGNDLESLTLAQGTAATTRSTDVLTFMDARMNASLGCVQVNDVSNAQSQFNWFLDAGTIYSTDCRAALSNQDFILDNAITLSTNPTSDLVEIELSNSITLNQIKVYNLYGQELLTSNSRTIYFSDWTSGIYLLKISTDKGTVTKRIIKN